MASAFKVRGASGGSALRGAANDTFRGRTKQLSVLAEAHVLDTVDLSVLAEAHVSETLDLSVLAEANVSDQVDLSVLAEANVSRFATTKHLAATGSPRVLVEVDWPGGNRRYAPYPLAIEGSSFVGYAGALLSIGEVVQGTAERRGSLSFRLLNSTTPGEAPSSLWSDANPPEGAEVRAYLWFEDDPLDFRIEVFRGVVDQVVSVSETEIEVSAISAEEKHDKLIGAEINATDLSDAPRESIGKFKPVVFGTVEKHLGIPVTTIGVSRLRASHLKNATTILLEDATDFPNSGTVRIGTEEVSYTGKSGNDLTTATRGANGTAALDHGSGTEVVEKGNLDVLLSGPQLTSVDAAYAARGDRLRKLDGAEYSSLFFFVMGQPLKDYHYLRFTAGWPRLKVPGGGLAFSQVQMNVPGSGNTAMSPEGAAADNVLWTERNSATIDQTAATLELEQTDVVEPAGEIVRVYAVVEFDNRAFPLPSGQIDVKVAGGATLGQVVAGGNLPGDLKDRAGLGATRAYDDEHTHAITDAAPASATITPTTATGVGGGTGWTNAANIHDGNLGTKGTVSATSIQQLDFTGFSFTTTNRTLTRVRAWCRGGKTGGSFGLTLILVDKNGNQVASVEMGTSPEDRATDWFVTDDWANVTSAKIRFPFRTAGTTISYEAFEVRLEIEYVDNSTTTTAGTKLALEHSRAMLFDVTATVAGDWAWFLNRKLQVVHNGAGAAVLRIVRLYFLVEYSPYRDEPADRILADVKGLAQNGEPTEVLKAIVTNGYLMGLASTAYDAGDILAVAARHAALSYRLDFAVESRPRANDLIARVCEQGRMLVWWEEGKLSIAFEEDIASFPAPIAVYRENDFSAPVGLRRTPLRDVATKVVGRYFLDGEERRLSKTTSAEDGSPPANLVARTEEVDLELVRHAGTAANLVTHLLDRLKRPRYDVELALLLPGLEVRRGDIIGLKTARWTFSKLQVREVQVDAEARLVRLLCRAFDAL